MMTGIFIHLAMSSLLCTPGYTHAPSTVRDRFAFGRTSAFSRALARTIATILFAYLLPGVKADCAPRDEKCYAKTLKEVGISLGAFCLIVALIALFGCCCSRRDAQSRLASAQQNEQDDGSAHNVHGGQPPYVPQYPPQAHMRPGDNLPHAYDLAYEPNQGYAPSAGSPPRYHLPPSLMLLDWERASHRV